MKTKQVFSDSRYAVYKLNEEKKYKFSCLKTTSPNLIHSPVKGLKTISLEIEEKKIKKLMEIMLNISDDIFEKCRKNNYSNYFASLVSSEIFAIFKIIRKLSIVSDSDMKSRNIIVANTLFSNNQIQLSSGNIFKKLFHNSALKLDFKFNPKKNYDYKINKIGILSTSTLRDLEFFFWNKISKLIPSFFFKGTLIHNRYSSLLTESLIHLARKGFKLEKIDLPEFEKKDLDHDIKILIKEIIDNVADSLKKYLDTKRLNILKGIFKENLYNTLLTFVSAKDYWIKNFYKLKKKNVKAFCHSFIVGPVWHAFAEILNEKDIMVISFQHGHGREFSDIPSYSKNFNEMVNSNLFFCFSEKSKQISDENFNAISKSFAVGLPYHYSNNHNFKFKHLKTAKFLYISTCLYSYELMGIQTMTWSDAKKAKVEIDIISNVLSNLKDECIYKTYPMKYEDNNYVIEKCVKRFKNLIYSDSNADLNYFKNHGEILITSRGTSTLGWCLSTRKPVIFINYNNHFQVTKEFSEDAKQAIFYFEYNSKDFKSKINELLERPTYEINREWEKMKKKRNLLWKKYFSIDSLQTISRAGKRASLIIESYL